MSDLSISFLLQLNVKPYFDVEPRVPQKQQHFIKNVLKLNTKMILGETTSAPILVKNRQPFECFKNQEITKIGHGPYGPYGPM